MKFFGLIALVALSEAFIWPVSALRADPVILENRTGLSICEIYHSPAGANNWSGGHLGSHCLEPGQKFRLSLGLSPSNGLRDLYIIFEDGGSRTYFGLDLGIFAYIVLGAMEAGLIERDISTR